jgi:hypothetical protein
MQVCVLLRALRPYMWQSPACLIHAGNTLQVS